MKLSVKKIDALRRELQFEVSGERVNTKLQEVFEEITRVAKVKGFRPGKAPRDVVEAHYGDHAREEMIKKLIPEVYREGVEKEKLDPIDFPDITDVELKNDTLKFKASIDIKPEISLKEYKGIAVKRKSAKVSDEEISKTLDYLKKSQGKDDAVLDDAFAHSLGYPSFEDFKQTLIRQMEMDKDRQNRVDMEQQVVDALLKDVKISVPTALLEKQIEHRIHELAHRFQSQRMPEAEIKKREDEWRKELRPIVERDIKAYFVFEAIAKAENITVGENENLPNKVMAFLLKEAKWEEA